jgi:hypothetical protein
LTFLPNLWWEYLDWAKEARTVVDQVTGGRPSLGMRALLNFIDQFIGQSFGRREFSLSPNIVEHTTSRFREELEVILTPLLEGTHCEAKYRFLVLEHPHLWDEDIGGSTSWRARIVGRSLQIPSHPTCRSVVKI